MSGLGICSWNIQGSVNDDTAVAMTKHRARYKEVVWFLQETSSMNASAPQHIFTINNNLYQKYMGFAWSETQRPFISHSAGIIVDDPLLEVVSHKVINHRIMRVTACHPLVSGLIHLISVYVPVRATSRSKFFHDYLLDAFEGISQDDHIIIGGDWNDAAHARDRTRNDAWRNSLWSHGLVPHLVRHQLSDCFRFLHPYRLSFSRVHSGAVHSASRIDTIFATPTLLQSVTKAEYVASLGSDHHVMYVLFGCVADETTRSRGPGYWHFHSALMDHPTYPYHVNMMLTTFLERHFVSGSMQDDIDSWFTALQSFRSWAIHSSIRPGLDNRRSNRDIDQLTKRLNDINLFTAEDCSQFLAVRNQLQIAVDLQQVHDEAVGHIRLQREQRQPTRWLAGICGDGNQYKGSAEDSSSMPAARAAINEHFRPLYTPSVVTPAIHRTRSSLLDHWPSKYTLSASAQHILDRPFTNTDMEDAIIKVDKRAAPGPDGIPFPVYKTCISSVAPYLARLAESLCHPSTSFPNILPLARTVLLFKNKGERTDLSKYRPVSVGNCDVRCVSKSVATRLDIAFRNVVMDEQTGFIKGRNSIDNAFVLNASIFAVRHGFCEASTVVFFDQDQEKAYDRVNHEWLFKVLQVVGVGPRIQQFFRSLYEHPHIQFAVNGHKCDPLRLLRGAFQGDPSSCMLYILVYQPFMMDIGRRGIGLQLNDMVVTGTSFADNSMILLSSAEQTQDFFSARQQYDLASDSKLNEDSATYIVQRPDTDIPQWAIKMAKTAHYDPSIEAIKHIGRPLSLTGTVPTTLFKERLEQLRQTVIGLQSSQLHMFGRAKYLNTFVLSTLWRFCDIGGIPGDLKNQVDNIMKPFLWKTRTRAFMDASVAYYPVNKGGLNVHDIDDMLRAITGSWCTRLLISNSKQGQLCRSQLRQFCLHYFGTDTSILLARRGYPWQIHAPAISHSNVNMWTRVVETLVDLNLSLPRKDLILWDTISPLQAAALPFVMEEYFPEGSHIARATWKTYQNLAHKGGFYSFADIFWVDCSSNRSTLPWYPIAIPSEMDLICQQPWDVRMKNKNPSELATALKWFTVEKQFKEYWSRLHPKLCKLLIMAVESLPTTGINLPGPRPVHWPGLDLPWQILQLATTPFEKYKVYKARTLLSLQKSTIIPSWPSTSPMDALQGAGWSTAWQELHRYPRLPNDARAAWWLILHNRPRPLKDHSELRSFHSTGCPCPSCALMIGSETTAHMFVHCPMAKTIWKTQWPLAISFVGITYSPFPPFPEDASESSFLLGFPQISQWLSSQSRMRFRLWYMLVLQAWCDLRDKDINDAKANARSPNYTFGAANVEAQWKRLLLTFLETEWQESKHFNTDWVKNSRMISLSSTSFTMVPTITPLL